MEFSARARIFLDVDLVTANMSSNVIAGHEFVGRRSRNLNHFKSEARKTKT